MTHPDKPRGCVSSIFLGTVSFMLVSLAGFSVWAFAGTWFYRNVGEVGLYAASAIVFVGLAGLLMHPLLAGPHRVMRFHAIFVPAFLIYAVIWSACWFALGSNDGEWLGSFLGCAAFATVIRKSLRSRQSLMKPIAILFLTHSAGYFLGGIAYGSLRTPPEFLNGLSRNHLSLLAKMLWGLFYGLGFGAGIGYLFYAFQNRSVAQHSSGASAAR